MATVPGKMHDYFLLWRVNRVRKYRKDHVFLLGIHIQYSSTWMYAWGTNAKNKEKKMK